MRLQQSLVVSLLTIVAMSCLTGCKARTTSHLASETIFDASTGDKIDLRHYRLDIPREVVIDAFTKLCRSQSLPMGYGLELKGVRSWRQDNAGRAETNAYQLLDDVELAAIRVYTGSAYYKINRVLREYRTAVDRRDETAMKALATEMSMWRPVILATASGLNKLPVASSLRRVYRGASLPEEAVQRYRAVLAQPSDRKPRQFAEFSFLSTSSREAIANNFVGNTKYIIDHRSGRLVSPISYCASEDEYLFVPGSDFVVKDVRTEPCPLVSGGAALASMDTAVSGSDAITASDCSSYTSAGACQHSTHCAWDAAYGQCKSSLAGSATATTTGTMMETAMGSGNPSGIDRCSAEIPQEGHGPAAGIPSTVSSIGEATSGRSSLAIGLDESLVQTALSLADASGQTDAGGEKPKVCTVIEMIEAE